MMYVMMFACQCVSISPKGIPTYTQSHLYDGGMERWCVCRGDQPIKINVVVKVGCHVHPSPLLQLPYLYVICIQYREYTIYSIV